MHLSPEQLRRICRHDHFDFATTAELDPISNIIGQPRGTRAIEFGIGIQSQGFNIYVLGPSGTGRATAIERFLQERTKEKPAPNDWIYVHNFTIPHRPRAIELPAGQGLQFQERVAQLVEHLRHDLPQSFNTDVYQQTIAAIQQEMEANQNELLQGLQQKANEQGFALLNTPSGFAVTPLIDGLPISPEAWQQLPPDEQQRLGDIRVAISKELEQLLGQLRQIDENAQQQLRNVDRDVAQGSIQHRFLQLAEQYAGQEEILLYLNELHEDVLAHLDDFAPVEGRPEEIDLRRFQVNLLIDHSRTNGAPVIIEQNPSFHHLMGRLEYEMRAGVVTTHFTNIKSGSLHQANGGYLIMDISDLLQEPMAWQALKRTLKSEQIKVQPMAHIDGGSQVLAKSLDPEPISLQVKIILMGSPGYYYGLYENDDDFLDLFKVRADFDSTMPRDDAHEFAYAEFVATRVHEEKLIPFDKLATEKIVEFGSRLAEHQNKLSTRFGQVSDLIRESSYWAGVNGRSPVTAADVQQAIRERVYRANQFEEELQEQILQGTILIATEGEVVGQVNALTVLDTGDYAFGQPGRITARTFMGDDGMVHIERETEMSGPIHDKGFLTLKGYLGSQYAQHQPLSLSASLTFEQSYGGVDGDSASSAELYALLSSLSNLPIKQSIAVTGSVNQRGEIQPIGGANEKIEGFFSICQARGLTGEQGVIIPASNMVHLMLNEKVVTAVSEGKFHIWAIKTIDEGLELLTGVPAGQQDGLEAYIEDSVHYRVQQRLRQLAEELKSFGEAEDEEQASIEA